MPLVKMDLGVGSFVYSGGLVSARTLLKNQYLTKTESLSSRITKSLRSSVALLVIGFIRMILTKGIDYQVGIPSLILGHQLTSDRNISQNMADIGIFSSRLASSRHLQRFFNHFSNLFPRMRSGVLSLAVLTNLFSS